MGRNLHSTDYIFQPKRGLTANLNTTANKNSAVDGELAYTTDRKQLWIFNGTEYEEVNKYTQYFFNSSGTQSGNRFNNFADMQDSIGGRQVIVQFEQDETLPAGAYDVSYQTWIGNGNNPESGDEVTITIPTGVTFSASISWQCQNGLTIYSTSANPVIVLDTISQTNQFDRTNIGCTTAPFFQIEVAGLHVVSLINGFGLKDFGSPVIHVTSDVAAYSVTLVITRQGIAPQFEDDTVSSDVPVVYGWLVQSSEARYGSPTHSGLDVGSFAFAADDNVYFSNASVIGFIEGQPANIPSTYSTVYKAIDFLGSVRLQRTSSASDPSTSDIADDGMATIHKNTSSGDVFLAYNNGGSIVKVQLS